MSLVDGVTEIQVAISRACSTTRLKLKSAYYKARHSIRFFIISFLKRFPKRTNLIKLCKMKLFATTQDLCTIKERA